MNKAELILEVADRAELSKKDAEAAINAMLDVTTDSLIKGDSVKLSGFGIFEPKVRAARQGTNPATQEKIMIPQSTSVSFRVSKSLKDKLN